MLGRSRELIILYCFSKGMSIKEIVKQYNITYGYIYIIKDKWIKLGLLEQTETGRSIIIKYKDNDIELFNALKIIINRLIDGGEKNE